MNRLGMAVDLAHVSYKTMLDAISVSRAPVMFSHSAAYTLCNHHRNVRDDVLQLVVSSFYSERKASEIQETSRDFFHKKKKRFKINKILILIWLG